MKFKDKLSIWWSLGLYWKWELLGVYLGLRCSACGDWYFNKDYCYADEHKP